MGQSMHPFGGCFSCPLRRHTCSRCAIACQCVLSPCVRAVRGRSTLSPMNPSNCAGSPFRGSCAFGTRFTTTGLAVINRLSSCASSCSLVRHPHLLQQGCWLDKRVFAMTTFLRLCCGSSRMLSKFLCLKLTSYIMHFL